MCERLKPISGNGSSSTSMLTLGADRGGALRAAAEHALSASGQSCSPAERPRFGIHRKPLLLLSVYMARDLLLLMAHRGVEFGDWRFGI